MLLANCICTQCCEDDPTHPEKYYFIDFAKFREHVNYHYENGIKKRLGINKELIKQSSVS